jgi:5,10-methylenetetrahydrofolate reductase
MTQVFFEWDCWESFLDRFGGSLPIPALVAIWPLTSYRLAVRLDNEVPGIVVPKAIQSGLEKAGNDARTYGFDLARRLYGEAGDRSSGVYVIAPFKNPAAALEILE